MKECVPSTPNGLLMKLTKGRAAAVVSKEEGADVVVV